MSNKTQGSTKFRRGDEVFSECREARKTAVRRILMNRGLDAPKKQDNLNDLLKRKKTIFEKIRKISVSSTKSRSSSCSSYQPRKTIKRPSRANTRLNISDPDKKSEASYRGKFCSFAGQKSADKRVEAPQGCGSDESYCEADETEEDDVFLKDEFDNEDYMVDDDIIINDEELFRRYAIDLPYQKRAEDKVLVSKYSASTTETVFTPSPLPANNNEFFVDEDSIFTLSSPKDKEAVSGSFVGVNTTRTFSICSSGSSSCVFTSAESYMSDSEGTPLEMKEKPPPRITKFKEKPPPIITKLSPPIISKFKEKPSPIITRFQEKPRNNSYEKYRTLSITIDAGIRGQRSVVSVDRFRTLDNQLYLVRKMDEATLRKLSHGSDDGSLQTSLAYESSSSNEDEIETYASSCSGLNVVPPHSTTGTPQFFHLGNNSISSNASHQSSENEYPTPLLHKDSDRCRKEQCEDNYVKQAINSCCFEETSTNNIIALIEPVSLEQPLRLTEKEKKESDDDVCVSGTVISALEHYGGNELVNKAMMNISLQDDEMPQYNFKEESEKPFKGKSDDEKPFKEESEKDGKGVGEKPFNYDKEENPVIPNEQTDKNTVRVCLTTSKLTECPAHENILKGSTRATKMSGKSKPPFTNDSTAKPTQKETVDIKVCSEVLPRSVGASFSMPCLRRKQSYPLKKSASFRIPEATNSTPVPPRDMTIEETFALSKALFDRVMNFFSTDPEKTGKAAARSHSLDFSLDGKPISMSITSSPKAQSCNALNWSDSCLCPSISPSSSSTLRNTSSEALLYSVTEVSGSDPPSDKRFFSLSDIHQLLKRNFSSSLQAYIHPEILPGSNQLEIAHTGNENKPEMAPASPSQTVLESIATPDPEEVPIATPGQSSIAYATPYQPVIILTPPTPFLPPASPDRPELAYNSPDHQPEYRPEQPFNSPCRTELAYNSPNQPELVYNPPHQPELLAYNSPNQLNRKNVPILLVSPPVDEMEPASPGSATSSREMSCEKLDTETSEMISELLEDTRDILRVTMDVLVSAMDEDEQLPPSFQWAYEMVPINSRGSSPSASESSDLDRVLPVESYISTTAQSLASSSSEHIPPQSPASSSSEYTPPPQSLASSSSEYTPPPQRLTSSSSEYAPPPQLLASSSSEYTPPPQLFASSSLDHMLPPQSLSSSSLDYIPPPQPFASSLSMGQLPTTVPAQWTWSRDSMNAASVSSSWQESHVLRTHSSINYEQDFVPNNSLCSVLLRYLSSYSHGMKPSKSDSLIESKHSSLSIAPFSSLSNVKFCDEIQEVLTPSESYVSSQLATPAGTVASSGQWMYDIVPSSPAEGLTSPDTNIQCGASSLLSKLAMTFAESNSPDSLGERHERSPAVVLATHPRLAAAERYGQTPNNTVPLFKRFVWPMPATQTSMRRQCQSLPIMESKGFSSHNPPITSMKNHLEEKYITSLHVSEDHTRSSAICEDSSAIREDSLQSLEVISVGDDSVFSHSREYLKMDFHESSMISMRQGSGYRELRQSQGSHKTQGSGHEDYIKSCMTEPENVLYEFECVEDPVIGFKSTMRRQTAIEDLSTSTESEDECVEDPVNADIGFKFTMGTQTAVEDLSTSTESEDVLCECVEEPVDSDIGFKFPMGTQTAVEDLSTSTESENVCECAEDPDIGFKFTMGTQTAVEDLLTSTESEDVLCECVEEPVDSDIGFNSTMGTQTAVEDLSTSTESEDVLCECVEDPVDADIGFKSTMGTQTAVEDSRLESESEDLVTSKLESEDLGGNGLSELDQPVEEAVDADIGIKSTETAVEDLATSRLEEEPENVLCELNQTIESTRLANADESSTAVETAGDLTYSDDADYEFTQDNQTAGVSDGNQNVEHNAESASPKTDTRDSLQVKNEGLLSKLLEDEDTKDPLESSGSSAKVAKSESNSLQVKQAEVTKDPLKVSSESSTKVAKRSSSLQVRQNEVTKGEQEFFEIPAKVAKRSSSLQVKQDEVTKGEQEFSESPTKVAKKSSSLQVKQDEITEGQLESSSSTKVAKRSSNLQVKQDKVTKGPSESSTKVAKRSSSSPQLSGSECRYSTRHVQLSSSSSSSEREELLDAYTLMLRYATSSSSSSSNTESVKSQASYMLNRSKSDSAELSSSASDKVNLVAQNRAMVLDLTDRSSSSSSDGHQSHSWEQDSLYADSSFKNLRQPSPKRFCGGKEIAQIPLNRITPIEKRYNSTEDLKGILKHCRRNRKDSLSPERDSIAKCMMAAKLSSAQLHDEYMRNKTRLRFRPTKPLIPSPLLISTSCKPQNASISDTSIMHTPKAQKRKVCDKNSAASSSLSDSSEYSSPKELEHVDSLMYTRRSLIEKGKALCRRHRKSSASSWTGANSQSSISGAKSESSLPSERNDDEIPPARKRSKTSKALSCPNSTASMKARMRMRAQNSNPRPAQSTIPRPIQSTIPRPTIQTSISRPTQSSISKTISKVKFNRHVSYSLNEEEAPSVRRKSRKRVTAPMKWGNSKCLDSTMESKASELEKSYVSSNSSIKKKTKFSTCSDKTTSRKSTSSSNPTSSQSANSSVKNKNTVKNRIASLRWSEKLECIDSPCSPGQPNTRATSDSCPEDFEWTDSLRQKLYNSKYFRSNISSLLTSEELYSLRDTSKSTLDEIFGEGFNELIADSLKSGTPTQKSVSSPQPQSHRVTPTTRRASTDLNSPSKSTLTKNVASSHNVKELGYAGRHEAQFKTSEVKDSPSLSQAKPQSASQSHRSRRSLGDSDMIWDELSYTDSGPYPNTIPFHLRRHKRTKSAPPLSQKSQSQKYLILPEDDYLISESFSQELGRGECTKYSSAPSSLQALEVACHNKFPSDNFKTGDSNMIRKLQAKIADLSNVPSYIDNQSSLFAVNSPVECRPPPPTPVSSERVVSSDGLLVNVDTVSDITAYRTNESVSDHALIDPTYRKYLKMLAGASSLMQRILTSSDWPVVAFLLEAPKHSSKVIPPWFSTIQKEVTPQIPHNRSMEDSPSNQPNTPAHVEESPIPAAMPHRLPSNQPSTPAQVEEAPIPAAMPHRLPSNQPSTAGKHSNSIPHRNSSTGIRLVPYQMSSTSEALETPSCSKSGSYEEAIEKSEIMTNPSFTDSDFFPSPDIEKEAVRCISSHKNSVDLLKKKKKVSIAPTRNEISASAESIHTNKGLKIVASYESSGESAGMPTARLSSRSFDGNVESLVVSHDGVMDLSPARLSCRGNFKNAVASSGNGKDLPADRISRSNVKSLVASYDSVMDLPPAKRSNIESLVASYDSEPPATRLSSRSFDGSLVASYDSEPPAKISGRSNIENLMASYDSEPSAKISSRSNVESFMASYDSEPPAKISGRIERLVASYDSAMDLSPVKISSRRNVECLVTSYDSVTDLPPDSRSNVESLVVPYDDSTMELLVDRLSSRSNIKTPVTSCDSVKDLPVASLSSRSNFKTPVTSCDNVKYLPAAGLSSRSNFMTSCDNVKDLPADSRSNIKTPVASCDNVKDLPSDSRGSIKTPVASCDNVQDLPADSRSNIKTPVASCDNVKDFPAVSLSTRSNFKTLVASCDNVKDFPVVSLSSRSNFKTLVASYDSMPGASVSSGSNIKTPVASCDNVKDLPTPVTRENTAKRRHNNPALSSHTKPMAPAHPTTPLSPKPLHTSSMKQLQLNDNSSPYNTTNTYKPALSSTSTSVQSNPTHVSASCTDQQSNSSNLCAMAANKQHRIPYTSADLQSSSSLNCISSDMYSIDLQSSYGDTYTLRTPHTPMSSTDQQSNGSGSAGIPHQAFVFSSIPQPRGPDRHITKLNKQLHESTGQQLRSIEMLSSSSKTLHPATSTDQQSNAFCVATLPLRVPLPPSKALSSPYRRLSSGEPLHTYTAVPSTNQQSSAHPLFSPKKPTHSATSHQPSAHADIFSPNKVLHSQVPSTGQQSSAHADVFSRNKVLHSQVPSTGRAHADVFSHNKVLHSQVPSTGQQSSAHADVFSHNKVLHSQVPSTGRAHADVFSHNKVLHSQVPATGQQSSAHADVFSHNKVLHSQVPSTDQQSSAHANVFSPKKVLHSQVPATGQQSSAHANVFSSNKVLQSRQQSSPRANIFSLSKPFHAAVPSQPSVCADNTLHTHTTGLSTDNHSTAHANIFTPKNTLHSPTRQQSIFSSTNNKLKATVPSTCQQSGNMFSSSFHPAVPLPPCSNPLREPMSPYSMQTAESMSSYSMEERVEGMVSYTDSLQTSSMDTTSFECDSNNNMTSKKKKRVRLKKLLSSIHDAVKRNKVKRTTS